MKNFIDIRFYQECDIKFLQNLIFQLGYSVGLGDLNSNIKSFLKHPENRIFVAFLGGDISGYTALAVNSLIVVPFRRGRIENLVVDKDHQRQGVGRALLEHVEQYALENDISILDVSSSLKWKEGHALYSSLGYGNTGKEEKIYFRKRIRENP